MSDNKNDDKKIAKRVARILRIVARMIEENPDMLKGTGLDIVSTPVTGRREKAEEATPSFDIFQIFAEGGEQALRQKLEGLDLRILKRIVSQHSFDPSKLAEKWRKKERLIGLIIDRVSARSDKGKVFEDYQ